MSPKPWKEDYVKLILLNFKVNTDMEEKYSCPVFLSCLKDFALRQVINVNRDGWCGHHGITIRRWSYVSLGIKAKTIEILSIITCQIVFISIGESRYKTLDTTHDSRNTIDQIRFLSLGSQRRPGGYSWANLGWGKKARTVRLPSNKPRQIIYHPIRLFARWPDPFLWQRKAILFKREISAFLFS